MFDTPLHPPVSVLVARLEAGIKRRKASQSWSRASSPSFETAGPWNDPKSLGRIASRAFREQLGAMKPPELKPAQRVSCLRLGAQRLTIRFPQLG